MVYSSLKGASRGVRAFYALSEPTTFRGLVFELWSKNSCVPRDARLLLVWHEQCIGCFR